MIDEFPQFFVQNVTPSYAYNPNVNYNRIILENDEQAIVE